MGVGRGGCGVCGLPVREGRGGADVLGDVAGQVVPGRNIGSQRVGSHSIPNVQVVPGVTIGAIVATPIPAKELRRRGGGLDDLADLVVSNGVGWWWLLLYKIMAAGGGTLKKWGEWAEGRQRGVTDEP